MNYVIFDLEATCFARGDRNQPSWFKNEIIEIGAVKLDENGVEISRFSKFAKPKTYPVITKFCNELTTITQDDIDYADDLSDVLIEFFEWVDGSPLISWGFYDKGQLQLDLSNNALFHLIDKTENHFSLKHLHGEWNNLRKSVGMAKALRMERIELEGTHHRGIDDALNIAKIFRKYLSKFKNMKDYPF